MEFNDLISIIIPAYNAEPFIKCCLESIFAQSYPFFEVLIIENCSTDQTFNYTKSFELVDKRIKVFQISEKGAAKARNFGIDHSKGEYLTFVDADDKICSDFLESLMKGVKLHDADISACSIIGTLEVPTSFFDLNNKNDRNKALWFFNGATCCKLYKRAIINEIRYDPIKTGEDPLFNLKIITKCPSIQYIKYSGYYYLENSSSITATLDINALDAIFYRNFLGFEFIQNEENINIDFYKFWLFDSIQNILIFNKKYFIKNKIFFNQKLTDYKKDYMKIYSFNLTLLSIFSHIPSTNIRNISLKLLLHINSVRVLLHYPFLEIIRFFRNKIKCKRNNYLRFR